MNGTIETTAAVIGATGPDTVEVRFKEGVRLTTKDVTEALEARSRHFNAPHHVVMAAPTDLDFDIQVMSTDHCGKSEAEGITRSITWVANSEFNVQLLNIYYAYFPSKVPLKVFEQEEEALAWLADPARYSLN